MLSTKRQICEYSIFFPVCFLNKDFACALIENIQLAPVLLLELSDLHKQYTSRYNKHVHKEVSCQKQIG